MVQTHRAGKEPGSFLADRHITLYKTHDINVTWTMDLNIPLILSAEPRWNSHNIMNKTFYILKKNPTIESLPAKTEEDRCLLIIVAQRMGW